MKEIEIFKSSDYFLDHPLYSLLLIFIILLIFYFNDTFFKMSRLFSNKCSSKEYLRMILFVVMLVLLTVFYSFCLSGIHINFLYRFTYHLGFLLFLLIIANPINDLYRLIFQQNQFQTNKDEKKKTSDQVNHERRKEYQSHLFGTIERLTIGFLIIFKAFETIGFILAAKALVRENLIKKSDEFAQMYYVGTLYSLVSVFVIWAICFW